MSIFNFCFVKILMPNSVRKKNFNKIKNAKNLKKHLHINSNL